MSVEAALIGLGAAAVRSATKLWLGDNTVAATVGGTAVDLFAGRLTNHLDQRKLRRMTENFTDAVAERIEPIVDLEFRGLPENERLAAIEAVRDTFDRAALNNDDLFAADLDTRYLERHIRAEVKDGAHDLSSAGTSMYDLLLRECCGYVIEIARGLPVFGPNALTEVLRRESEIISGIRTVLARMPQRRTAADFAYDYRQLVARTLDQVEMFGATLSDASRQYPLSVAYLGLTAVSAVAAGQSTTLSPNQRINELLARDPRLFVRGEAGLGKTTLLQWIAVRCARGDFKDPLTGWNDCIPFFIRLRRYADRDLPSPETFLDEIGRHIANEMPKGWVQQQLRTGQAVVLVDGVDELAAERRAEARLWLRQLVVGFPEARYVVTSRPSAAPPDWLRGEAFAVADLQPMSPSDVRVFVDRWHQAIRSQHTDRAAQAELEWYERRLLAELATRHHLRKLAGYPLLCALLCALHRDRNGDLPDSRMELYDVALQMMLERRDAERRIPPVAGLNRTRKTLLLADLAYWFIRNDLTDAAVSRAVEQLGRRLEAMPEIPADIECVYRHLLERTGLLREPVDGRVDFVHRTFQEYLAARAAIVDTDDVGTLVAHGHLDQWHEVIVMAAGHASRTQREELLTGLLTRGDREQANRYALHLLAVACLETSPELDPRLRADIERRAADLLPPKSVSAARAFASAGLFVLDLLASVTPHNAREAAAMVRAAAEMGVDEAIPLLARFSHDRRAGVQRELVTAWPQFDPDTYAQQVLAELPVHSLDVYDQALVPSLRHIRQVTELACTVPADGRLDFVPAQVTKLRLFLSSGVVLSTLTAPVLTDLSVYDGHYIDVRPLTDLPQLTSFTSTCGRFRNLAALGEAPRLRRVALLGGLRVEDLGMLPKDWPLEMLSLCSVDGLTSLASLRFVRGLRELRLEGCPRLRRLDGARNWASTMEKLMLRRCAPVDLTPLVHLPQLRDLDLLGSVIGDLTPLAALPRLERLTVSSARTTRDLAPVSRMAGLRELRISRGGKVNLASLAGKGNLTIRVEDATQVIGAESLGPGSRVEIWDGQHDHP
ncbi:MAG TPA: NACHT domain-containing protein [Pseudonocardiaceae bacterium]|nr:NACHT domain-containing protein [Pseudonocardiaceae bacterium]